MSALALVLAARSDESGTATPNPSIAQPPGSAPVAWELLATMTGSSFATYLSSARARLCAAGASRLVAMTFTCALCLAPQAGARTTSGSGIYAHRAQARAHELRAGVHGTGARAHKAACSTAHTRHGAHACSPSRAHKHRTRAEGPRAEGRHGHATGAHHVPAQGKAQIPPTQAPGGPPGTTCSGGANATLDEEGTFACAGGGEPGCQEGLSPVVADDGSTLVCEPEQNEAGGEEAG
ncbi:MAG TPA: hypothetical protein VGH60_00775 [Solirubrobacteraceae bacterium]